MNGGKQDLFSNAGITANLRKSTVRGGISTGIAQLSTAGISLLTLPLLARLLDPADFGLIAMVMVFTNFARMLVDAGLAMATVQQDKITRHQISNLFWITAGLGLLIAIVVAASSPLVAWIFDESRLIAITLALSVSYVFSGLTIQHRALMRRNLRFRDLAVIQVVSVIAGQAAGVSWAWFRADRANDYWALVWIPVGSAFAMMILTWTLCPWRPTGLKRGTGVRTMLRFGADITGSNILSYLARNLDNALIGWRYGEVELGFYERAYKIFLLPVSQITTPVSSVAIPTLSRLAHDETKFRVAYFRITTPVLAALSPLVCYLIFHAELVIPVMLGDGWDPSIDIFRWLALVGLVQPFSHTMTWILVAHGRSGDVLRLGIVNAVTKVASFAIGLPWGAEGVAISYALVTIVGYTPFAIWFVSSRGPINSWALLWSLLKSNLLSIFVILATACTWPFLYGTPLTLQLALTAATAAATWAAIFALTPSGRSFFKDLSSAGRSGA